MADNPDKTEVAKDLFTWCTKEKTDTWHIVRNHDAKGFVDRVICKACGSEHKYRKAVLAAVASPNRPAAAKRPSASAQATNADKSDSQLKEIWMKGIKKWGEKVIGTFDATISYGLGDVFNHAIFGKGLVQARRENKIDVLFQEGMKTLPSAKIPAIEHHIKPIMPPKNSQAAKRS